MKNSRIELVALVMALVALGGCKDDDISVFGTTQGSGTVNVSFITGGGVTAGDTPLTLTFTGSASGGSGSGV